MTNTKAPLLIGTGLLCALLGMSAATEAQAFFTMDERPPPNGANGLSLNGLRLNGLSANGLSANGLSANGLSANGLSANGLSANGLSANGLSANGLSANGVVSQRLKLEAVILANGETVSLR